MFNNQTQMRPHPVNLRCLFYKHFVSLTAGNQQQTQDMIDKLQATYNATGIDGLIQNLLQIAEGNISQEEAENLAGIFFDITAGEGDCFDSSVAGLFESICHKFPKSKILKNGLTDIYSILTDKRTDSGYDIKMEILIGKRPENENDARKKVDTLKSRHFDELHIIGMEPDWSKCIRDADKIEEIFNRYPQSEYIALRFAELLSSLTLKQDAQAGKITVRRLEVLFEQAGKNGFPDIVADSLTWGLNKLSQKQNEVEGGKTINRIEEIASLLPQNKFVLINLAYALEKFSDYKQGEERANIISRLREIAKIWEPAGEMADRIRERI
jgi:hypothetical protein